jgi:hypothetical protein
MPAKSTTLWVALALLGGAVGCESDRIEEPGPAAPAAGQGAAGTPAVEPVAGSGGRPAAVGGRSAPAAGRSAAGRSAAGAPAAGSAGSDSPPVAALALELKQLDDCSELEKEVRAGALKQMNKTLDDTIATYKMGGSRCVLEAGTIPPAASASAGGGSAMTASATNNQVAGVDEADFIKNDTRYIYELGHGAFRILEAWPAEQTHEISRVAISGTPTKLFVEGERALVYVSVPKEGNSAVGDARFTRSECSYGYDCQFTGDGNDTSILIFDISDRTAPKQLRRLDLTGSLIAARRIGAAAHSVVTTPPITFPVSYWPEGISQCSGTPPDEAELKKSLDQFEALRAKNTTIIETTPISAVVPSVREGDTDYAADECSSVYRASGDGSAYTTLVSLDMAKSDAPVLATIVTRPGAVYASAETLYMAVPQQASANGPWFNELPSDSEGSSLHAFRIGTDPSTTAYIASGVVKGRVLNQFAMDEHSGHLRIATTTGHLPDPKAHNTLSVLKRDVEGLQLVGQVDQIATSEDIRSVRFEGDRGFMVTFKKTDPLFAFDLSDPSAPKLLGELMIPGFSTYIHMLDDKHLLTIGYDADDHGDFAFFDGVIIQIFDVSNPAQPTLAHKVEIGTRGSSSEALANHLAFNLFQGKLALPMTVCEGGGDGMYGTDMTFSGLIVYDVSAEQGIKEHGRVANPQLANGAYDHSLCSNWWSNASSEVKRSVFLDDFVYAISPNVLHVQDTRAMGRDVATVRWQN